jgi:hypothetical protein
MTIDGVEEAKSSSATPGMGAFQAVRAPSARGRDVGMVRVWIGVLMLVVLQGCGGDDEPLYVVFGAIVNETIAPVEDVEVCPFERDDLPCTSSDRAGQFSLQVPPGRSRLTYQVAGHQSRLRTMLVEEDPTDLGTMEILFTSAYMARQEDNLGISLVPGTGIIGVSVSGSERDGAQLVVDPPEGDGPYYVGPNLEYDPELEATVAAAMTGGAMLNVPPGTFDLSVQREGTECTFGPASFPGSHDNAASVLVIPDHLVFVGFRCE